MADNEFVRIGFEKMHSEFVRILINTGFTSEKSEKLASVFTTNSMEGVYSHGVNRFPRFIKNTREGFVKPDAMPGLIHQAGCIEQWNGNFGPGPLNAEFATLRAMELAETNSIGMLTLSDTNHWMRAGAYGWLAARKGFILICWTNTCPNMPAWGGKDPRLGNNPMVIAVPYRNDGIVLDFAMSQFSYGKLESYRDAGKQMPYPAGYSTSGELSTDPAEILSSWRILPTGYWKGSSLSLMLDILATVLSGGISVHEVKSCTSETGVSQVFIAINPRNLNNYPSIDKTIERIIADLHNSVPAEEGGKVRYPGENIPSIKEENFKTGIPVKKEIWEHILTL
ncbi:MAG: 3-dehydro-L-gulonate 2-dehydrogenase [Methanosarcina sp.]